MRNELIQRDEIINRLSSFLFKEGKLKVKKLAAIKSHVLLMETQNNRKYILKKHINKKILLQQWGFFKMIGNEYIVPFHPFPNGREFLTYNNHYYTIAPYIEGKKLNYQSAGDRRSAVDTLKQFHENASNIHMKNPVERKQFLIKWHERFQAFKQTESLFYKYGFGHLYADIVQTTTFYFQFLSQFPWQHLEKNAKRKGTWIHGDVASHNFIRTPQQTIMIDFDLLHRTPQLYDFIQLGQRFLPYEKWEIDELIGYNMVPEEHLKMWAYAMALPSDVFREWLYFLRKKPASVFNYLNQLDNEWVHRRYFFKSIKNMIN
ncbi:phosphotransferase [Virgibacillus kimchii]